MVYCYLIRALVFGCHLMKGFIQCFCSSRLFFFIIAIIIFHFINKPAITNTDWRETHSYLLIIDFFFHLDTICKCVKLALNLATGFWRFGGHFHLIEIFSDDNLFSTPHWLNKIFGQSSINLETEHKSNSCKQQINDHERIRDFFFLSFFFRFVFTVW